MFRGGKIPKVKGKKYNDMFDMFTFLRDPNEIFGHVDFIKASDIGVTAEVTMKKEVKPSIFIPLRSASIMYDGMGHAISAIFDVDDKALDEVRTTLKKHTSSNFTSYNEMHKPDPAQKRKAREVLDWKLANPGLDFPIQSIINIEEVKEIQCSVCKAKIQPNAELHYVAKSCGLVSLFSGETEEVHHDAYDCPLCGSQILLGQRLKKLK